MRVLAGTQQPGESAMVAGILGKSLDVETQIVAAMEAPRRRIWLPLACPGGTAGT